MGRDQVGSHRSGQARTRGSPREGSDHGHAGQGDRADAAIPVWMEERGTSKARLARSLGAGLLTCGARAVYGALLRLGRPENDDGRRNGACWVWHSPAAGGPYDYRGGVVTSCRAGAPEEGAAEEEACPGLAISIALNIATNPSSASAVTSEANISTRSRRVPLSSVKTSTRVGSLHWATSRMPG